ncbi:hypothetical protein Tco_1047022 [Tanacetum coccineum]
MDKIRLSRAQILWGMFHKKNIDYVYLLWEDLLFQIEYKDAKKTNKMSYPRFTKIIIDYFMSKDASMRSMLESKAYHTYDAFASGEKDPKPKYIRKKSYSDTSPKKKPIQATKGTRLKSKAKVAKLDRKKQPAKKTKVKGDGVDTQLKVPDEQQQKTSGIDEGTDSDDEDNDDDDGDNDDDGDSDHDDDSNDERTESDRDEIPDLKLTNVDQTEHEEEENDDEFYEE